ncbi:hypothetical protein pipiens_017418 [Culex pipiens pipiens]|uniref:Uncharacterized protein n=1 Tax=Culex pipiens pipiens TaxID=38569 RepID=A0ABD1CHU3_CULPP
MRLPIIITSLLTLHLVAGQEFQCSLEKIDSSEDEHCVFRDVNLKAAAAGVKFSYPAGAPKPSHVAFLSSSMKQVPSNFLNLAGPELKVLRVESCGLQSVAISSGLEALYAKDNTIVTVIVHQSGPDGPLRTIKSLKTVYLNGNNFDCTYLERMLQHLQANNLQTPPGGPYPCKTKIMDGFCCTGPVPTKPTTPGPIDPKTTTERANVPPTPVPDSGNDGDDGAGSSPSWLWFGVGAGVAAVVIAAIVGFVVWKNQQKKAASNYRVPPGNLELS